MKKLLRVECQVKAVFYGLTSPLSASLIPCLLSIWGCKDHPDLPGSGVTPVFIQSPPAHPRALNLFFLLFLGGTQPPPFQSAAVYLTMLPSLPRREFYKELWEEARTHKSRMTESAELLTAITPSRLALDTLASADSLCQGCNSSLRSFVPHEQMLKCVTSPDWSLLPESCQNPAAHNSGSLHTVFIPGQVVGAAAKTSLEMAGELDEATAALLPFQLPNNVHPGRQLVMAQRLRKTT